MQFSNEQIEKICRYIVDDWDMDTLIQCAVDSQIEYYTDHTEDLVEQMNMLDITLKDVLGWVVHGS